MAKSDGNAWHSGCFACGNGAVGLHLQCHRVGDHHVEGRIRTAAWMQGYDGRLHGGIITTLLDSAMCQCLHLHGAEALTAKLEVRFLQPVPVDVEVLVLAMITEQRHGTYVMRGELRVDCKTAASASAMFVSLPRTGGGRLASAASPSAGGVLNGCTGDP